MIFFNINLKYLRKQKDWTQDELAAQLAVKSNTISNYEKGVSNPDFDMLDKIVKIFGVSVDELLFADLANEKTYPMSKAEFQPAKGATMHGPSNNPSTNPFDFMQQVMQQLQSVTNELREVKQELKSLKKNES